MKQLLFLLILILLSCSPHIPNPKVTSLDSKAAEILVDTLGRVVYNGEFELLETFDLTVSVRVDYRYLISVNDIEVDTFLNVGDHLFTFQWDDLLPADTIVVIAGVNAVLDEQELVIPLLAIIPPKVASLTSSTSMIFVDSLTGSVYDQNLDTVGSFVIDITVRDDYSYQISANTAEIDTFLSKGDHQILFNWNDLLPAESVVVTTIVDDIPTEQNFTVPIFENITSINSEIDTLYRDSSTGYVYKQDLDLMRIFTVGLSVKLDHNYRISVNDVKIDTFLLSGDHEIEFNWGDLLPTSFLTVTTGTEENPDEQIISIPVIDSLIDHNPYLKYQWNLKPGDSQYMNQWEIDSSAHINVEPVWVYNRGKGVRVAIIDVDIDPYHEDLADNVIAAYDAEKDITTLTPDTRSGYHGTMVSGVIGAVAENGVGIVGVAPEVELILISEKSGRDAHTIRAFEFAREMGAQVINCSWGTYNVSDAVSDIIKEMYESGITVVFAAGNSGNDLDKSGFDDESELPWVIGVGASTELNDYWSGSDYGSQLDLIAPGAATSPGILGLNGMGSNGSSRQKELVNENYQFWKGCSFSAPTIAGVAALMYVDNPLLSPDEIRTHLIETADKVGGSAANYDPEGFDQRRFYGKVNASNAVKRSRSW